MSGGAGLHEWPTGSQAVQLVAFDQAKGSPGAPRIIVKEEARRALLEAVGSRPVRAVAVCGLYRTGKSLLLNLLSGTQGADRKSRFLVGDSIRACTAGIWARASAPAPDGTVCLLLDCEGSGSTDRNNEHDARLFALAVLVSSLLIFNSRGVISDTSVQALAVAASLAQHIFRQHEDLEEGQRLAPAFLWVLRDFALALEDLSGNAITSQQYMENILTPGGQAAAKATPAPGGGGAERWQGHREARETIKALFPDRDCATLCIPVEDEEQLQVLGQLALEEMRPKFVKQVGELRAKVLRGCPVLRSPSGETATGGAWIALLESHVKAMNSGGVPKLGSAWQHVSEQECARAVEEGTRVFSASTIGLASSFPCADEEIDVALRQAETAAKERYTSIALGDSRSRAEFEADLLREIRESGSRLRKENRDVAMRSNEAWLQKRLEKDLEVAFRGYQLRFDQGTLTVEECDKADSELTSKLQSLRAEYLQAAIGPEEARAEPLQRLITRREEALGKELAAWRRGAARGRKGNQGEGGGQGDARSREGSRGGKRIPSDIDPQPKCCVVQ